MFFWTYHLAEILLPAKYPIFLVVALKISYIFYYERCIPISVISVVLHYEKLCRAPTSANDAIFQVILDKLYFDSFSTKVSYFTADIFFVRKGAKKTPQRTKILISPVRNKILKSETHFLSSKQKYNAIKIISKFFHHKKLELPQRT